MKKTLVDNANVCRQTHHFNFQSIVTDFFNDSRQLRLRSLRPTFIHLGGKFSRFMASSGPQQQERAWPFLMIEPLFYEELELNYPFLPEWILERMPRNINTNRLNLDKNNMSGGWIFARYNGSGTLVFPLCIPVPNGCLYIF